MRFRLGDGRILSNSENQLFLASPTVQPVPSSGSRCRSGSTVAAVVVVVAVAVAVAKAVAVAVVAGRAIVGARVAVRPRREQQQDHELQ